ncbi:hypothetical protein ABLE91_23595 [Aquabacter sp. CN5-332]|uniref:hypothetical protein n=1 Tax=Aquabacter sp. CN5-332 TaxID=3156608 RepID=UPI0032B34604
MTDPLPQPSAEQVAHARALYAAGRTIKDIMAETGFTYAQVYVWIDREIGPDGGVRERPMARRMPGTMRSRNPGPKRRRALANRIWRAAEAQVCEIETRLAQLGAAPAEAERDARALAVLARVVRELAALDAATKKSGPKDADTLRDDEDARAPTDLDTFRRELARRLDALRADGAD